MAMLNDLYDWADNAGITITDQDKIEAAVLEYKQTAKGKIAIFSFEMKPGVVPFPEGLSGCRIVFKMEE